MRFLFVLFSCLTVLVGFAEAPSLAMTPQQLQEKLQQHIRYNAEAPNIIGHIIIEDHSSQISQSTWLYVKKALDYYKDTRPIFIILELNTPGGEVFAAQKISDALKEMDIQLSIPVVVYINNWAISAGAMLAYSGRYITTVKDGSMGAAEPIIMSETGEHKTASEKENSAIRTDFASRAGFFDRNPYIAEAMVDKDVILVLRDGKIIKLDSESQIKADGANPDVIISPKGKLLTLSADQMYRYGVADMVLLPERLQPITDAEKESGKWPASKMLLFHQPFFKEIPNASIDSYQVDWKTRFFALLSTPAVASMLMLGIMVGFYMEFSTPGFGLPGTVAVTCLILVILSSFALEIANWLELILLCIGLAIILVDVFVLPTFGLLGVIGALFFFGGLIGMMVPGIGSVSYEFDTNTFNAAGDSVLERIGWLCASIVLSFIIMVLLARFMTPKMAAYSKLVLQGNEQSGYIASDDPSLLPQPGSEGVAAATLRPAGKVIIEDKLYDAISSGGFIEKDSSIVVLRLDGSVIVVGKRVEQRDTKAS